MTREMAEILALQAFTHIIAEPPLCSRFMDLTGIDPRAMQTSLSDSFFLAAVLDFLLGDEPALLAFCTAVEIKPELPAQARQHLPGGQAPDWS